MAKAREAKSIQRTHEFSGLTEDARVELAVTRIRADWAVASGSMVRIGQTLVDACHDGDEKAALTEADRPNSTFTRIARSLGTLEGGPSAKVLSGARRVAAATQVVRGHFWAVLPFSHKEVLVRLAEARQITEGAKLAVEFGWTVAQTESWVDERRAAAGKPKTRRGVRLGSARASLERLAAMSDAESLDRVVREFERLDGPSQAEVQAELERAGAVLARLRRRLSGR
jgi:hypothetical protein